jgi:hypothetical protein
MHLSILLLSLSAFRLLPPQFNCVEKIAIHPKRAKVREESSRASEEEGGTIEIRAEEIREGEVRNERSEMACRDFGELATVS